MSAAVHAYPRAGFLLNSGHCSAPSGDRLSLCLLPKGHDGEHEMVCWDGFRIRAPWGKGETIPFRGFVGG